MRRSASQLALKRILKLLITLTDEDLSHVISVVNGLWRIRHTKESK